ncbi:MAG: hypothetical protein IPH77_11890 [Ignavibacteria bacterium]|nr:hypothetical protein [Ignavibacteria bacterium]
MKISPHWHHPAFRSDIFQRKSFSGKVFATGDILASDSFRTFLDDAKKSGVFPLWVPYIFMGMPNFRIISYNPRS